MEGGPQISIVIPQTDVGPSGNLHPFWLTFEDAATEDRYRHFSYVTSSFLGGKLWHLLALAINLLFFIWFHGIDQGFSTEMFTGRMWIGLTVNTVATVFMGVALFIERLYEYRELFFLVSLFTHWPSFLLTTFFGMKGEWSVRYFFVVGCLFFCTFVVQARFARVFFIIGVTPIATLIISTSTVAGYWDKATAYEVVLWLLLLIPPAMLRMFEVTSRRCFIKMERCEAQIEKVNVQIERTQDLIANFFAKTPTKDFLSEGKRVVRSRKYPDTCMIVTDLAGFTAWTSRTPPKDVIRALGRMFATMDALCPEYDVEKVSTVGDCFVGAVFPSEVDRSRRASNAAKFCTSILNTGGELQLRIGVHIGLVTAAFVGNRPPKFDLFGDDFEQTKSLESGGVPGKVHATHELIDAAAPAGKPEAAERTPVGVVFATWHSSPLSPEEQRDDGSVVEFFSALEVFNICQALVKMSGTSSGTKQQQQPSQVNTTITLATAPSFSAQISSNEFITSTSFDVTADAHPLVVVEQPSSEFTAVPGALPTFAPLPHSSSSTAAPTPELPGAILSTTDSVTLNVNNTNGSSIFGNFKARVPSMRNLLQRRKNSLPKGSLAEVPREKYKKDRPGYAGSSNSAVSSIASKYSAMGDEADVAMNPILLQFNDPENERLFTMYLKKTGLVFKSNLVMVALEAWSLLCLVVLGCLETARNRMLFASMAAILCGYVAVMLLKVNIPHWSYFTWGTFVAISILGAFLDFRCGATGAQMYTSGITLGLFQNNILVTQFMLENRLVVRLGMNLVCCVLGQLSVVVRNFLVGDDILWGPVWVVGILGLGFVSYFADFTLRSAFAADRLLSIVLRRMRGKHHETARAAMDVMLPSFVSARLIGGASKDQPGPASALDEDDDAAELDTSAIQQRASNQLWEFEEVAVMFITFYPNDVADMDEKLATINAVLDEMEAALQAGGIHKIKTVGSTLMCVSGINRDESNYAVLTVLAARQIVERQLLPHDAWRFTVGIHVGPCFGAVLGTKALIFDIFADAVNIASRMSSTARPRTIQVSEQVVQKCSAEPSLNFRANAPVMVKGKGLLHTHELVVV